MVNEDLITAELREYVRRYVLWHFRSLRDSGISNRATIDDLLSAADEGICDAALWFDRTKSDVSKFKYVVRNYVRSQIKLTLKQFRVLSYTNNEEDYEVKASEEFGGDAIISEELRDGDSDVELRFTPFNDDIYVVPEMSEEEIEEDKRQGEKMDRMLGCLTAREKRVIGNLYGMAGYEEMKISEVARMEGISIYQVKKVVEEAEGKMRNVIHWSRQG